MSDLDVKEILYSIIDSIGKKTIQINVNKDILSSKSYIKEILKESIQTVTKHDNYSKKNQDDENIFVILCESLTHFLLTVKSVPSQRKILIKNIEIDLIIPDQITLNNNCQNTLIIKFAKRDNISQYLETIKQDIQTLNENIWIVSDLPLNIKNRNYILFKNENDLKTTNIIQDTRDEPQQYHPFVDLIVDIEKFLKVHNNKNLRLVHF